MLADTLNEHLANNEGSNLKIEIEHLDKYGINRKTFNRTTKTIENWQS